MNVDHGCGELLLLVVLSKLKPGEIDEAWNTLSNLVLSAQAEEWLKLEMSEAGEEGEKTELPARPLSARVIPSCEMVDGTGEFDFPILWRLELDDKLRRGFGGGGFGSLDISEGLGRGGGAGACDARLRIVSDGRGGGGTAGAGKLKSSSSSDRVVAFWSGAEEEERGLVSGSGLVAIAMDGGNGGGGWDGAGWLNSISDGSGVVTA